MGERQQAEQHEGIQNAVGVRIFVPRRGGSETQPGDARQQAGNIPDETGRDIPGQRPIHRLHVPGVQPGERVFARPSHPAQETGQGLIVHAHLHGKHPRLAGDEVQPVGAVNFGFQQRL
jgi:hypothetical protein